MTPLRFPRDFVFGVATSSYQIEGAVHEGGRGPSIWDTFCRTPGKVRGGDTGDVACDHYHRHPEDIALMRSLGVQAYRFSIAWPRIFPTGLETTPNAGGLDFYERLVDGLLAAGITPWVTLYHWDLPQGLQDRGGWASRGTVDAFARFAEAVGARLGGKVAHFITHNEPWCVAMLGHMNGEHAPGHKDWPEALVAAHHVLLSHGVAVPILRAAARGAQVGITLNLTPGYPASASAADADATRHFDGFFNRWYLDPLVGRGYPADMVADYRRLGRLPANGELPFVEPGDLETIAAAIDFLGVNYYTRAILRSETVPEAENLPRQIPEPAAESKTDIGWEVYPDGLEALLLRLARDYPGLPLAITENGASYFTPPDPDGVVHDAARVAYFRGHLAACARSIAAGVPLVGYFAWSLMDNFEWAYGYDQRFGLVWVDFATQVRIPKDSARFYAEVIRTGAVGE
ncbi:MAG: GH1 family beta-glucosidase [Pseudomonadota bacterium]|nr:GH1 family beta-glucosidase [Pseudomonadota bacterium]